MLALLLACSSVAPVPAQPVPTSAHWPHDPVAAADACKSGSKPDCSALLTANRRAWAWAVVHSADGSVRVDESRGVASMVVAAAACKAGDGFACLGPIKTPDKQRLSTTVPFTRRITFVDSDGVPRPGVRLGVYANNEHKSLLGYLDSDVRGQVLVPEKDAVIHVLGPAGVGSYHGGPRDVIELETPQFYGKPEDHSLFAVPQEDPAWAADPVGTLAGNWRRQPNVEADRQRPGLITIHWDLPGTTGGGIRMDSPPKSLAFRVAGKGHDRVSMQGDLVEVSAGDGLIRVDRSGTDKKRPGTWVDLVYPLDHDTIVFVVGAGRRWSWPEVYSRR